eukprot:gb/GECG01005268.1/.p1 GENE.gb/GECG01005268.1/~~gb/GECG01005268.1/.p1  ORF type:complete len:294 (+),score=15.94 gb/GECG01005268.1/:1-882(+)
MSTNADGHRMGTVVNGVNYGKCTCCKMIQCFPCRPMKYEMVDEGVPDQLTFIVKPETLCCGTPCCIDMRSIDIHRISKNGNVTIEQCGVYCNSRVTRSDVIRMTHAGTKGAQTLKYDAVNSFPKIRSTPIEKLPNDLLYDTKQSIVRAVNDFLRDKRVSMGREDKAIRGRTDIFTQDDVYRELLNQDGGQKPAIHRVPLSSAHGQPHPDNNAIHSGRSMVQQVAPNSAHGQPHYHSDHVRSENPDNTFNPVHLGTFGIDSCAGVNDRYAPENSQVNPCGGVNDRDPPDYSLWI